MTNATNAQATKRARSKKAQPVAQVETNEAQTVEALTNDEAQTVEALAVEVQANEAQPVEVSLTERAQQAQALMLASIQVRVDAAPNDNFKKNMLAEKNQFSGRNALLAIEKCIALDVDFAALATAYAITDKNAHDYVAIYAAQKIRKSVFALACGMTSVFDGYTQAIMSNLVKLQSLSNRGSQRALSNKVVFDEDMQTEAVRSFKVCEPSTASTQASSTRQAMRFLNVCNVIKSRKDDAMTLTDSQAAQKLQAMFSA